MEGRPRDGVPALEEVPLPPPPFEDGVIAPFEGAPTFDTGVMGPLVGGVMSLIGPPLSLVCKETVDWFWGTMGPDQFWLILKYKKVIN